MKKTNIYAVAFLCGITLILYAPLFTTEYIYTDETVQLWFYRPGSGYQMFIGQGRAITEKMFQWMFGHITTIKDVTFLRLVSLLGWVLCIPVWYAILHSVAKKENLPPVLIFMTMVYMIAMPAFTICVSWTSVMELFMANTSGLISGYILYRSINQHQQPSRRVPAIITAIFFGCISLFTYQNGYGCFLLPFLLHCIAKTRISKMTVVAVAVYLATYGIYYLLFKLNLAISHLVPSERTNLHINVLNKLIFLFTRPLNSAFHFTWLFNEKSIPGLLLYATLFGSWIIVSFVQKKQYPVTGRLTYFAGVCCFFGLIYLPSLLVQENYASNRTLFALNIAVFLLTAETLLAAVAGEKLKQWIAGVLCFLFIINARYNFTRQFLEPVKLEYARLRKFVEHNYKPGIDTVFFIRPHEDFFEKKFSITRSWDEFGVPSTFFEWTPGFLVKQIVFEKTGSRELAEKLVIKNWLGKQSFIQSGDLLRSNCMLVDTEEIMNAP